MTKECPICGDEPTEKIKVSRETYPDPSRTELEIHIKRNHTMDEIQKHANKGKKKESEKAIESDVDKVISEILDGSPKSEDTPKTKKTKTGRPAKSKRGASVKEPDTDTVGTLEPKALFK